MSIWPTEVSQCASLVIPVHLKWSGNNQNDKR